MADRAEMPAPHQGTTHHGGSAGIVGLVVTNTLLRLCGFALSKALLLVTVAFLARYLGSAGFGKYALVLSYLSFFQILTDLGIGPILLQKLHDLPKEEVGRLLGNILLLKLGLAGLAVVLSIAFVLPFHYGVDVRQAVIIGSIGLLAGRSDLYAVLFQARLEQKYITYAEVLEQCVMSALIALVIVFDVGFLAVMGAVVAGNSARFFVSWLYSRKLALTYISADFRQWREVLRLGFPIALMALLGNILANLDLIIVERMLGNSPAGAYGAAKRLIAPWSVLPATYISVVYPVLYGFFRDASGRFERAYELSFKYILVLILPVATAITLTAKSLILLVYGPQFADAAGALAIVVWSQVFLSIRLMNDYLLITAGKQRLAAFLAALSAGLNVVLSIVLTHRYGILGTSISVVASYAVFLPLQLAFSSAREFSLSILRVSVKPLVASGAMAMSILFVLHTQLVPSLLVGLVVYAAVLTGIGGIGRQEIGVLSRGLFKSRVATLPAE